MALSGFLGLPGGVSFCSLWPFKASGGVSFCSLSPFGPSEGASFCSLWPFGASGGVSFTTSGLLSWVPPHKLPKMARFPMLPYKEFISAVARSIF